MLHGVLTVLSLLQCGRSLLLGLTSLMSEWVKLTSLKNQVHVGRYNYMYIFRYVLAYKLRNVHVLRYVYTCTLCTYTCMYLCNI